MWKIFFIGTFFIGLQAHAQIITTVAGGITGHGGYWGDGGPATAAAIGYTGGIAVDAHGNLFIADGDNQRLREVYAAIIIGVAF